MNLMPPHGMQVPAPPAYLEGDTFVRKKQKKRKVVAASVQDETRAYPQQGRGSKAGVALCSDFQAGCCWYDRDCWKSHAPADEDSGYKMTLCEEFARTSRCPAETACQNAHGRDELRTPKAFEWDEGYKTSLCTWYLLDDTECNEVSYNCYDAHGKSDLRPVPLSMPPTLCGTSFTYSDAHVHLDHVLLARRYGSAWMSKRAICTHRPCYNPACAWAHGEADKRPRLPFDKGDLIALAEDFKLLSGGTFGGCVHSSCEVDTVEETVRLAQWGREALGGRVYVCFGIHPTNFESWTPDVEDKLVAALRECGAQGVAWGECGLDYYHRESFQNFEGLRPQMCEAFAGQARVAVRLGMPLVVHSRDAEEDTLKILRDNVPPGHPVYMHSATSSLDMVARFLDYWSCGYVGISGCVSYHSAVEAQDLARALPLDRILLETDGPYMAPQPHKFDYSHPGHIPWVAEGVARAKDLAVSQVLAAAHDNFRRFFRV